ncbi:hypothetical protein RJ639_013040 [Escallonia herrerae]|uniref:MSP domain-containing protein n=1 Tax=Escallonia herrerae TaxID=1293975 RepID=A0AA88VKG9_9ASTE|nr:hypothetical protein RJ639_013040 [Escallonia herrerae]
MDRLVKPDVKELSLTFTRSGRCSATFRLSNLMHTMSVAVSLTTTNPSLFSFAHPFSVIPPLSTSSFTLLLSQPSDHPPLSTPLDTLLVKSSMLPTGKAHPDDLRRLFSKPGPHVFKDATIPISFVGPHVAEFLLTSSHKILEISFLLSKAISFCDEFQLLSLLKSAASRGNAYFVSALIDAGADVSSRDPDGVSAMSVAVKSGDIDIVELLIDAGYVLDNMLDRFLHDAAEMDRVELMEVLCLGYLDMDVNATDLDGRTALHIAAIRGHVEAVRFLVSVGCDPEVVDSNGWTALHCAASEGHVEAVELLLNCSTYAKYAVTKEGKTAFALAVDKGYVGLYDILHLGDVLHRAARIDDIHGMKSCIAEGGKVNVRDQNGWTPLHRAAFKGRIESVKLLLSHGAQVDVVDDAGYTPLHRAVEAGHVQVALYLVARGARTNMKGLIGVVPLHLDSLKNHPSLVTPLCQEKERA